MGCSISVFFANAFMYKRTMTLVLRPPGDLLYLGRYIDDIIAIWRNFDQIATKAAFAITTDEHIKLTWDFGDKKLVALDVAITLEAGVISTTLHRKATDCAQYIHWDSVHPEHLKRSVPFAQALRYKRLCSNPIQYEIEVEKWFLRFRERDYPAKLLIAARAKADRRDRASLQRPGLVNGPRNRMCFIDTFDARTVHRTKRAVNNIYSLLLLDPIMTGRTEELGPILPTIPPTMANKVGRKLGSTLGPIFKRRRR